MNDKMLSTSAWAFAEDWLDEPEAVRTARARGDELGCPAVSPATAALLTTLAASVNATHVVEVGTGTGVSAAALLAGMTPDGILTSIDVEAEHQRVARETLNALGHDHTHARLIAGRELEVLPRLADEQYDLVFVDGDRAEYPAILTQARRMLRTGGLVVFDGVLSDTIADTSQRDAETTALRDLVHGVRDADEWVPALLTVGHGVLVATKRSE